MAQLLWRIAVTSTVSAAVLGKSRSGKPESKPPTGDSNPAWGLLHDYRRCKTDEDRRKVIREAMDELKAIRYSKRAKLDLQTREGRLLIGKDARPAHVVAYQYGYSVRHVHRLRAEARQLEARLKAVA